MPGDDQREEVGISSKSGKESCLTASGRRQQCQRFDTPKRRLLPTIEAGTVIRTDHCGGLAALAGAAIHDDPELGPPLKEVFHVSALVGAAPTDHNVVEVLECLAHGMKSSKTARPQARK
jgi:hypothetical protein